MGTKGLARGSALSTPIRPVLPRDHGQSVIPVQHANLCTNSACSDTPCPIQDIVPPTDRADAWHLVRIDHGRGGDQTRRLRRRSEFKTTEIDDAVIAKAANMGLMRMPRKG